MAAMSSNGFGAYLQDDGRVSTFGHNVISGDSLAGKAGIIHIAMLGNHTLAVYHDGTVRVSQRIDNDVYVNKVRQFLRRHSLDGLVLCACGNADHVAFVTTDGEVY